MLSLLWTPNKKIDNVHFIFYFVRRSKLQDPRQRKVYRASAYRERKKRNWANQSIDVLHDLVRFTLPFKVAYVLRFLDLSLRIFVALDWYISYYVKYYTS